MAMHSTSHRHYPSPAGAPSPPAAPNRPIYAPTSSTAYSGGWVAPSYAPAPPPIYAPSLSSHSSPAFGGIGPAGSSGTPASSLGPPSYLVTPVGGPPHSALPHCGGRYGTPPSQRVRGVFASSERTPVGGGVNDDAHSAMSASSRRRGRFGAETPLSPAAEGHYQCPAAHRTVSSNSNMLDMRSVTTHHQIAAPRPIYAPTHMSSNGLRPSPHSLSNTDCSTATSMGPLLSPPNGASGGGGRRFAGSILRSPAGVGVGGAASDGVCPTPSRAIAASTLFGHGAVDERADAEGTAHSDALFARSPHHTRREGHWSVTSTPTPKEPLRYGGECEAPTVLTPYRCGAAVPSASSAVGTPSAASWAAGRSFGTVLSPNTVKANPVAVACNRGFDVKGYGHRHQILRSPTPRLASAASSASPFQHAEISAAADGIGEDATPPQQRFRFSAGAEISSSSSASKGCAATAASSPLGVHYRSPPPTSAPSSHNTSGCSSDLRRPRVNRVSAPPLPPSDGPLEGKESVSPPSSFVVTAGPPQPSALSSPSPMRGGGGNSVSPRGGEARRFVPFFAASENSPFRPSVPFTNKCPQNDADSCCSLAVTVPAMERTATATFADETLLQSQSSGEEGRGAAASTSESTDDDYVTPPRDRAVTVDHCSSSTASTEERAQQQIVEAPRRCPPPLSSSIVAVPLPQRDNSPQTARVAPIAMLPFHHPDDDGEEAPPLSASATSASASALHSRASRAATHYRSASVASSSAFPAPPPLAFGGQQPLRSWASSRAPSPPPPLPSVVVGIRGGSPPLYSAPPSLLPSRAGSPDTASSASITADEGVRVGGAAVEALGRLSLHGYAASGLTVTLSRRESPSPSEPSAAPSRSVSPPPLPAVGAGDGGGASRYGVPPPLAHQHGASASLNGGSRCPPPPRPASASVAAPSGIGGLPRAPLRCVASARPSPLSTPTFFFGGGGGGGPHPLFDRSVSAPSPHQHQQQQQHIVFPGDGNHHHYDRSQSVAARAFFADSASVADALLEEEEEASSAAAAAVATSSVPLLAAYGSRHYGGRGGVAKDRESSSVAASALAEEARRFRELVEAFDDKENNPDGEDIVAELKGIVRAREQRRSDRFEGDLRRREWDLMQ